MGQSSSTTASDIVIDCLYAIAIGVNIYIITDQLTNGALSRSVSLKLAHFKGRVRQAVERQEEYRKSVGRMFWEAENIKEGLIEE